MSLDDLCAIRENYYRHPTTGQEYHDETVDTLIIEKTERHAEDMVRRMYLVEREAPEVKPPTPKEKEHVMAKKSNSKVVDIGTKRAEKAGLTCRKCGHHVKADTDWDVCEGDESGIHACPSCDEMQETTILSTSVTATDENLILLLPKSLILDLNSKYDPNSKLDFGTILANTLRPYIVDLLKGDESCFYRE